VDATLHHSNYQPRGSRKRFTRRLTPVEERTIILRRKQRVPLRTIASELGVGKSTVSRYARAADAQEPRAD
jgi:DNA invertase Pin-like site-specific DNA recombinase